MEPNDNLHLVTATGEKRPFVGSCTVNITVGSFNFKHQFLIAEITQRVILGMDFLSKNSINFLLENKCMSIKGEKVPIYSFQEGQNKECSRVSIAEDTIIPALSETIILGNVIDPIPNTNTVYVEPSDKFTEKYEALVAKTLVNPSKGIIPLRILNVNDTDLKLYKNSVVANIETVHDEELIEGHVDAVHVNEVNM
ncbi:hypothetical protein LOTGIDRAFT_157184 [Lottia gigantea]|uniref:Peptidase A2 domain-containing protein n=1 Tax=Lottia gigantea TaxID=225164 RepID=V4AWY6_LOTGI|nr:hypothetical protein LOTGIDRAFT_157184 [Lottia gigantea]ESP02043.1 hypothetical protein LOTGIDRAFT_157184 [Lottia gigantea]